VPSSTEPPPTASRKVTFFPGEFHRIHQGFVRRVRLDAAKFKDIQAIQSGEDLIQDACFFHAAAAVGDQYALPPGSVHAAFQSRLCQTECGLGYAGRNYSLLKSSKE
jgi:hypothetical protein